MESAAALTSEGTLARGKMTVTYEAADTARIPDALTEGATWMRALSELGVNIVGAQRSY